MCDPFEVVADIVATATGNPELIPLINGGITAGEDLAKGKSIGKSFGHGVVSGVESLAGQEAAGAVGIGGGNSAVNDALGVNISPSATGLPDIGGGISDAFHSAVGSASDALGLGGGAGGAASSVGAGLTNAPAPDSLGVSGGFASAPATASNVGDLSKEAISLASGSGSTGGATSLGTITGGGFDLTSSGIEPSAAAATAPAATSAFSAKDLLPKNLGQGLALGNAAYQAISGPGKLPSSAAALGVNGAATAPLLATEKAGLNEGATGQLSPAEQANITQFVQHSQNELIQQLSAAGVTNFKSDSRYIQGMQDIQQKALAAQQQYIQQAIQNGISAGGAAAGNIGAYANAQIEQDKEFQDSLKAAFGSLGSTYGAQPNKEANA